jgi:hypothetical protein
MMEDIFDLCKALGCDLQFTTDLEGSDDPRPQFGWRVRGGLGESNDGTYTTLRSCLHSCMSWLKYVELQRAQADMQEIAALCRELKCAFTISSCRKLRDPTLEYEWRIMSGRRGESNACVHDTLDTCYSACVLWLKQIKAQRTP